MVGTHTHSLIHSFTQGKESKFRGNHPLISKFWVVTFADFKQTWKIIEFDSDTKFSYLWSSAAIPRNKTESLKWHWLKSVTVMYVIHSSVEIPMLRQHSGSIPPISSAMPCSVVLLGHLRCTCIWGAYIPCYFSSGHGLLAELWKKESSIIMQFHCILSVTRYITSEGQNAED